MLLSSLTPISDDMKNVLGRMKEDHISKLVKDDTLIVSYGQSLVNKV